MEKFEQKYEPFISYCGEKQSGEGIATSEAISMSHTDTPARDFLNNKRLPDNLHTDLIPQVICEPIVMVAGKKINFYTAVTQSCQFSQHTNRRTRHHVTIFHPKIKNITKQVEFDCLLRQISQKIEKTSFACLCRSVIDPQMNIRYKYMKWLSHQNRLDTTQAIPTMAQ